MPPLSQVRTQELIGRLWRYLNVHNLTKLVPEAFNAYARVVGPAERAGIKVAIDHERGYHGNRTIPQDYTFNAMFRALLDAHYVVPGTEEPEIKFARPLKSPLPTHSEYWIVDAEGAPGGPGNTKIHAGLDWHDLPLAAVFAPEDGHVVEAHGSDDAGGQVFGGTVRVQVAGETYGAPAGHIWVFRHIQPTVATGDVVKAGQMIARIAVWQGMSAAAHHTHIELWRSWQWGQAGYKVSNMIDPLPVLTHATALS